MTNKTVTIDLTEPFPTGHGGPVKKVVLRAPLAGDLFELGEIWASAFKEDGTRFSVENPEIIKQYLARLVIEPDALILEQTNLHDAYRIKGTLIDFFITARQP